MQSRLTVVLVSLLLVTPLVIFWLWLLIEGTRVATLCPEGCRCDRLYGVKCHGSSITTVPLIRFTGVRRFRLTGSNITLIERDSFVELTELKRLNIERCRVRAIELGAFNGLTELTELSIEGNKISEIIPGMFESLRKLEHLDLFNNGLQHFDSDVFSGLVNLRYIDLSGNKLQYLHPDTFLRLPNIKHINLHNNPALQIPTNRNFLNSHSLSNLDISGCHVSSLSGETFTNISGLEWLDLKNNNLRTVDINILRALPKLSALYLNGNPLQCDCRLNEVWRLCEDRNIQTGSVQCDTPSEVKGMEWGVLGEWECLEGNVQYYGDYRNTRYSYTDIDGMYTERNTEMGMDIQTYVVTQTDTDTDIGTDTDMKTIDFDMLKYKHRIFAVTFTFGTTGNVILLIIIICNKDMRTVPNMYIINLAISDIIFLTALFIGPFSNTPYTWIQGNIMCRLIPFCHCMAACLSAYSVAVLSIQRYRVIANPLHVHVSSPLTWRVTVATVCGVWIVSALFTVPPAISDVLCTDFTILYHMEYYQKVVIFDLLVCCVIPLCVIAFTYIKTARHLVENSRPISDGTQNPQLQTRINTARTVVGLTVVFMISFVPYHACRTFAIYLRTEGIKNDTGGFVNLSNEQFVSMNLISTCFLTINPCLNPVALFCTSSQFRQHLKRYLTWFCKTNSPPTDIELERKS